MCLGREVEIGQVENRDKGKSLQGGRRLGKTRPFQAVMTLKETTVVVWVEGSGGRENGEESRGQIMRDLLCHAEKFKLYPVGKGE